MATQVAEARAFRTVTEKIVDKMVCELRYNDIIVLHEGAEDEVTFRVIAVGRASKRDLSEPKLRDLPACHIDILCLTMDGKERKLSRLSIDVVRVIQR